VQNIRVAAVQFEHAPADKNANLAKIQSFAQIASQQHVQILAFPSAASPATGFSVTSPASNSLTSPSPFPQAHLPNDSSNSPAHSA